MSGLLPTSNSSSGFGQSLKPITERDPLEDSQILNRLQAEGPDELSRLFGHMRDNLRAMISARLDTRLHSRVDASDIVQETYIRALKSLDQYLSNPKIHPVIWLRLLGKNLLCETHRQQFRAIRSPAREIVMDDSRCNFIAEQISESMPSILSRISEAELSRKVESLIEKMGDNDREILEMRHKDEMSLVQIAEILSIPVETAKKRYQRALARFRDFASSLLN
jgi:RNA polymerase sigma-70 factor (ECF subfamily)